MKCEAFSETFKNNHPRAKPLCAPPIDDPQFRKDVLELMGKYEVAAKQKTKKKSVELDPDFGKIL